MYIEGLNEHIVKIVESESHEFVVVARNLEAFRKEVFTELKEGVRSVKENYAKEKGKTELKLGAIDALHSEVSIMEVEKKRLEKLIQAQDGYGKLVGILREL